MSDKKIRLGIVGVGGVGAGRLKTALDTPEVDLVAVADKNPEFLKAATDAKPSVKAYDDAEKMFGAGDLDAVMLNVPHFLHKPFALAALQAGLHVLVEKPMAITISECDAILAAAKKAGKIVTVHHQKRIEQRHLVKVLQNGAIGPLVRATYIRNSVRNNRYYRTGAWRGTWKYEGGGVLINQAIHDIDAMLNLTGQVAEVRARLENLFHDHEVEDSCTAAMEFPNGATGTFVANVSSFSPTDVREFEGEKGVLVQKGTSSLGLLKDINVYGFYDAGDDAPKFAQKPQLEWQDLTDVEPFAPGNLIRDFALSILNGTRPLVDAEGAREAVHFFNAVVLSHFLEKPMRLPLDPAHVDEVFKDLANGKWKLSRRFKGALSAVTA